MLAYSSTVALSAHPLRPSLSLESLTSSAQPLPTVHLIPFRLVSTPAFPSVAHAPGSRRPRSSWQMGDPGQGGRPDSVLPRPHLLPPPPGRLDHKARTAAAEPSSRRRPSDGCALPYPPPARSPPQASGQRPTLAEPHRRCRLYSPRGARVTMPAPRTAAFLLLHLVLQPWQRTGAQATPQGKWPPLVPSAPSPLSLS